MEATNVEIFVILIAILGFGSSLIHYTAYAKSQAKVAVRSNQENK
jgi:hypothetical protein